MKDSIDNLDLTYIDKKKVTPKDYNYTFEVRIYIREFLHLVILLGSFLVSPTLQAETPTGTSAKVASYTLQRERISELAPSSQQARKPPEIDIIEQAGIYRIKIVAVIDAPASYVLHVLTDYHHIYRLNPSIIESEVVQQHDDGSVNVRTRVVGCAAYFCDELDRVERVRILPSGDLYAEIIPELSEFKSGKTHWHIKSLSEYSEVTYIADMEPDVFIPPLLGTYLIKQSIREEMQVSFANLEKIASILAEEGYQEGSPSVQAESSSHDSSNYNANNSYGAGYKL